MSILDTLFRGKMPLVAMESKAAFDAVPVGVQGRPQYPSTAVETLQNQYRRNEIVYACIGVKMNAAKDPRLFVQQRTSKSEWQEVEGHPLRRLMMRPNSMMDEAMLLGSAIASYDIAGRFYAEIVRAKETRLPLELHPLDPAKVTPVPGEKGVIDAYEFRDGNEKIRLPAANVIDWKTYHPSSRYLGLSPLEVALGTVDADRAQTDFTREFFNNAGVPSGMLKIKGRTVTKDEADEIKARWRTRFGRAWGGMHDIAVMDENAEYEKMGANLDELTSETLRELTETRICMVFGVPPLIVYAFAGLKRSTYSNLKEATPGFWDGTMSPLLKSWRSFLTWRLLPEFEPMDLITGERVRLQYDMSQVAALQEDVDSMHARARESFKVGAITLNELRAKIGEQPDPAGDYYLRGIAQIAEPAGVQPTPDEQPPKRRRMARQTKAMRDSSTRTIERRIRQVVRPYLLQEHQKAAAAVRGG